LGYSRVTCPRAIAVNSWARSGVIAEGPENISASCSDWRKRHIGTGPGQLHSGRGTPANRRGKIGWWRDQSHTACKDRTSVVNGRKSCLSSDEAGYRAHFVQRTQCMTVADLDRIAQRQPCLMIRKPAAVAFRLDRERSTAEDQRYAPGANRGMSLIFITRNRCSQYPRIYLYFCKSLGQRRRRRLSSARP
jgi:hypothetical protein